MFAPLLRSSAQWPDRPATINAHREVTWGELAGWVDDYADRLAAIREHRVALRMESSAPCIAILAALDQLACDVFLMDDRLDSAKLHALATELQLDAYVELDSADNARPAHNLKPPQITRLADVGHGSGISSVTILTSGTTGKPKAARHTWTSLARPIRRAESNEVQRWLLTYRPHLYAGLQVLLQCFVNGGTLVLDDSRGDVSRLIELMVDRRVGYLSATPSYVRRLFLLGDRDLLRKVPLVQITLGGEVVDDAVLSLLADAFPAARIIHIYATTELGRCFSVTDRRSGFPERFLHQASPDGIEMKIDDGELLVKSANRMQSYDARSSGGVTTTADGWTRSGDLVELRDGRVHFIGRRSDLINVGGNKVAPLVVEAVVRAVPGVADVRVYGKGSSIAGQLVACDVVPAPGYDAESVKRSVAEQCRTALAGHERPRLITMVNQIALTAAGKVSRGQDA